MGETFANHLSEKGLISKIYKELQLNSKKKQKENQTKKLMKKWAKT